MKKNIFTRIIAIALVAMSIMSIATTAFAYTEHSTSGTRYVTSDNDYIVNVRTGPGTSYPKEAIDSLYVGAKVTLVSYATVSNVKWYKVKFEGTTVGWIKGTFLTSSSTVHDSLTAWEIRYGWKNTNGNHTYSTPNQIKNIQRDLKALGYNLGTTGPNNDGVDGDYGSMTKEAIRQFRVNNSLGSSTVASEATKQALYNATH